MVSPHLTIVRAELGPDWVAVRDAARIVGTYDEHFTAKIGPLITRESRSLKGKSAKSVGYAYLKADCEKLALIRRVLGTTALRAAQTLKGIRTLHEHGLLDGIESQQNLEGFHL